MTSDFARLRLFLCVADLVDLRDRWRVSDLHRASTDQRTTTGASTKFR
jgi:hypothetical protein